MNLVSVQGEEEDGSAEDVQKICRQVSEIVHNKKENANKCFFIIVFYYNVLVN